MDNSHGPILDNAEQLVIKDLVRVSDANDQLPILLWESSLFVPSERVDPVMTQLDFAQTPVFPLAELRVWYTLEEDLWSAVEREVAAGSCERERRTKNRISMSGRGMMLSWLEGSSCFWFRMLGCQLRLSILSESPPPAEHCRRRGWGCTDRYA